MAILQKVPRGIPADSHKVFRHDIDLLDKAGDAYKAVGLRTSGKKAVRNQSKATILGGELDGRRRHHLCAETPHSDAEQADSSVGGDRVDYKTTSGNYHWFMDFCFDVQAAAFIHP